MNISNRLKKMKNQLNVGGEFCACHPQIRTEVYIADLCQDSDSSKPVLKGKPVPDVCPDCCKPTEKDTITVQICDSTTSERFPNE
jgi:hypothetical protein